MFWKGIWTRPLFERRCTRLKCPRLDCPHACKCPIRIIATPYRFIPWSLWPMLRHWRPDNLAWGHLGLLHRRVFISKHVKPRDYRFASKDTHTRGTSSSCKRFFFIPQPFINNKVYNRSDSKISYLLALSYIKATSLSAFSWASSIISAWAYVVLIGSRRETISCYPGAYCFGWVRTPALIQTRYNRLRCPLARFPACNALTWVKTGTE